MAIKNGTELEPGDTLLGESGGESLIYEINPSSSMPGLLAVETEHGYLYLDPEQDYTVEDEE
jgi:hypothetical protein